MSAEWRRRCRRSRQTLLAPIARRAALLRRELDQPLASHRFGGRRLVEQAVEKINFAGADETVGGRRQLVRECALERRTMATTQEVDDANI